MGHTGTEGESDGALVQRVLAGDVEAYAGLVARYRDRLGRYALHRLGNQADAEDALQETLVRAYRALERCAGPARAGGHGERDRAGAGGRGAPGRPPGVGRGDPVGTGPPDARTAGGVSAQARGGPELRGNGGHDR